MLIWREICDTVNMLFILLYLQFLDVTENEKWDVHVGTLDLHSWYNPGAIDVCFSLSLVTSCSYICNTLWQSCLESFIATTYMYIDFWNIFSHMICSPEIILESRKSQETFLHKDNTVPQGIKPYVFKLNICPTAIKAVWYLFRFLCLSNKALSKQTVPCPLDFVWEKQFIWVY